MSDLESTTLAAWRASIDAELGRVPSGIDGLDRTLRDAVHYTATGPGKRLRGLIVMASYDALGGTGDAAPLAASIEIVHAYSLAHDDLPCMDNAELRRGRPTTHRAYDVTTATLAGIVMVPIAVRCAVQATQRLGLDDRAAHRIVETLMRASGARGMIGGQVLDLEGEGRALSLRDLEQLHHMKTGALITAAFTIGAIAARANDAAIDALERTGNALGLAFQIADDILDATESSEALGKAAGHDVVLAKSTYASLLGVDQARTRVAELLTTANVALASAGLDTPVLRHLTHFVGARRS